MGVKERRERERADVRARILDAARDMFARDGYEAVTMRAIADRIEYSAPVIYGHFQDKNALLQELCFLDFRALGESFARIGRLLDPVERLRRIGAAYVDFALANPAHFRFMFMTPKPYVDDGRMESVRGNPEQDAYAFLCQTVADAIAADCLRPEYTDVARTAQLFWGAAHGIVSLQIAKCDDPWIHWDDARATALELIEAVTRGVVRAPA